MIDVADGLLKNSRRNVNFVPVLVQYAQKDFQDSTGEGGQIPFSKLNILLAGVDGTAVPDDNTYIEY